MLAFSLLLYLPAAIAVEVPGLYRATVRVESRNNEQERRRAVSEAMQEVLGKVSGLNGGLNQASIRRALNNPEPYVQSWSTQASLQPVDPNAEISELREVISIQVTFYETEIQRLLDENNIPIWPANRPETLVWLVVQDELGERQMLSSGNSGGDGIVTELQAFADQRGLPILFPLLDLEDQLRLNANVLWELDETAILNASLRYRAESILAMRLYRSLSGEVLARSLYLFRDNAFGYEEFDSDQEEFLLSSINLATVELSQYYAVLLSAANNSISINFRVDGINSPADYAALIAYLNTLEGVSSYTLKQANADSLTFQLETGDQLRQLVETIALQPSLQELTELSRDGTDVSMHYLWKSN